MERSIQRTSIVGCRKAAWAILASTLAGGSIQAQCTPGAPVTPCIDVLHDFQGPDGERPYAAPVIDGNGAVYGTTRFGGRYGQGVLYRWQKRGLPPTVLHHFKDARGDGAQPSGNLVVDTNGNIYGSAASVIYRYDTELGFRDPDAGFHVVKSFSGTDGELPFGGLIRDAAGNLYGSTQYGGDPGCSVLGCGTLFKVDSRCVAVANWSADPFCSASGYTVTHRFGLPGGGANPTTPLARSGADLVGTTPYSIFRLSAATGLETLRTYGGDAVAYSSLVRDPDSEWLYGIAAPGVIFRIDSARRFEIPYRFTWGADGSRPSSGLLIDRAARKMYGTTLGAYTDSSATATDGANYGTVYEYDYVRNTVTTLYTFRLTDAGAYGNKPVGGLTRDATGNLYGVTNWGGAHNKGVLYRVRIN